MTTASAPAAHSENPGLDLESDLREEEAPQGQGGIAEWGQEYSQLGSAGAVVALSARLLHVALRKCSVFLGALISTFVKDTIAPDQHFLSLFIMKISFQTFS